MTPHAASRSGATAAPAPPPAQRWSRAATWVITLGCWLAGLLCLGMTLDQKYPDMDRMTDRQDAFILLDLVLGLVACAMLPAVRSSRRRRAGLATVLVVACGCLSSWSLPAALYTVVRTSSRRDVRWIVGVFLVFVASGLGYAAMVPDEHLEATDALLFSAVYLVFALWGLYRGSRAALVDSYRERAEALQREQHALVARTLAEERTAIAREMHDTISHRLAVMSLHAGALSVRPDRGAEQVRETADLIQATAQQASEELRSLLAVLREDPSDRIQPSMASLASIVDEARGAGVEVTVAGELPGPGAIAPQQAAALAQVLREGVANAVKHAPGEPVEVVVARADGGVRLLVRNPLAAHPSVLAGGFGLVGCSERLRLAGGTLSHGSAGGIHQLEAWVPCPVRRG